VPKEVPIDEDLLVGPLWRPGRMVSGGQTGADRGGLMAGAKLGIPTAGWMPKGYKCDDRIGEKVAKIYNLWESDGGYTKRDRQNADMSDAIIGFLLSKPLTGRGTTLTMRYFISGTMDFVPYQKTATLQTVAHNVIIVWDLNAENKEQVARGLRAFVNKIKPKSLMVAGPCERTDVGIANLVCEALCLCFDEQYKL